MNKLQVFRVCAVCGKRHAATYGFRNLLARNGIAGDKAAIVCIRKLSRLDRTRRNLASAAKK